MILNWCYSLTQMSFCRDVRKTKMNILVQNNLHIVVNVSYIYIINLGL